MYSDIERQGERVNLYPYHPFMVYLPPFWLPSCSIKTQPFM